MAETQTENLTEDFEIEELIHNKQFEFDGKIFTALTSPVKEVGYYQIKNNALIRLTNYIIVIEEQIKVITRVKEVFEEDFSDNIRLDYKCYLFLNSGERLEIENQPVEKFNTRKDISSIILTEAGIKAANYNISLNAIPSLAQASCRDYINFSEKINVIEKTIKFIPDDSLDDSEILVCPTNQNYFIVVTPPELYGYYQMNKFTPVRISSFIFELNEQIRKPKSNNENKTYFSGKIVFADKIEYTFDKLDIDTILSKTKFKRFVTNLCGYASTKTDVAWDALGKHILSYNSDIPDIIVKDFGYNNDFTEYITENAKITKETIAEVKNPMSYEELFGNNKLTFVTKPKKSLSQLKKNIREKLLTGWDSPEVMMTSLAYTMLPIVYPYLKDIVPNKFFLMLQGPSGSGKSTVAKWMQRFYGKFESLLSWTSTEASITYAGSIMKDALFVVDDFKQENFPTSADIRNVMRIFQNYSDGTGRLRAKGLNNLSKEKIIQGFLMLSAEDVVISQTSTIARGIIVEVKSKKQKTKEIDFINDISNDFTAVTASYIQFLFNNEELSKETIQGFYGLYKGIFEALSEHWELSHDNQARMIQNFTLLYTSWACFRQFLFDNEAKLMKESDKIFNEMIVNLFLANYKKVDDKKSYVKFISALWEYAELNKDSFVKFENWGTRKPTTIGCYQPILDEFDNMTSCIICISLNQAYNKIDKFLSSKGGIGTSIETLRQQLVNNGFVKSKNHDIVKFENGKQIRGVEWIGNYPKEIFK